MKGQNYSTSYLLICANTIYLFQSFMIANNYYLNNFITIFFDSSNFDGSYLTF